MHKRLRNQSRIEIEARLPKVPDLLVDLANAPDDGFGRFRRKWRFPGYSDVQLREKQDQLCFLWGNCRPISPNSPLDKAEIDLSKWKEPPEWEGELDFSGWEIGGDWIEPPPIPAQICELWLRESREWWFVRWTDELRYLIPKEWDLPVLLAVGCLLHGDKLALCWNPDCPARYFMANRKDQRYCSAECAWPAQKAAKLKWWKKHRSAAARRTGKQLKRPKRKL